MKLQKVGASLKYRRKKEDIFKGKATFDIRNLILSTCDYILTCSQITIIL